MSRPTAPRIGAACAALALLAGPALGQAPASPPARASVDVNAGSVEGAISALLYGQFLEFMFEGVKGGLSAELIRGRGFELAPNATHLPAPWARYPDDRNDDYGLAFAQDDAVAYPVSRERVDPPLPRHALRVEAGEGVVERHGVFQSRVPVRAGVVYEGYLWLRTEGYRGPVQVALEEDVVGGAVLAEATVPEVAAGDWRRYPFTLTPGRDDPLARFAILFPGTGTVWVDQVSLLPGDAVGGVRADVLERIRALQPAFLRWPGGNVAQDYHWVWGVGPRDARPDWINLSWRDERESGDIGTAEYLRLSREVGAEPTLTVNVEGRGATPEEAAAWVAYVNGSVDTPQGALRARHGHPEPFGVRIWELGNEIWGDWVRGHSDAATYARNIRRYHDAMRAVDPTLRFIAVGDNDMAWNRTVLREAGDLVDVLAIHHYYGRRPMAGDLRNLVARPLHYERFYGEMVALVREVAPGRDIRLAINEWGLDLPESQQYSILAALYGARLMNVFERASPFVEMSAVSDLVNGWPGGVIQASRHGVFVTPIWHVNRMWATHLGAERLALEVDGPTFDSSAEGTGVPVLDAVASRTADGDRIYLKLVNTDLERALDVEVRVRGVRLGAEADLEVLSAPDLETTVGFDAPDAIRPTRSTVPAGQVFTITLPSASAAILSMGVLEPPPPEAGAGAGRR